MVRVHRWFDIYCMAYQIWRNTIDMRLSKTCKGKLMKNELIELLNDSFEKQYEKRGLLTAHHTAEDLIANGVTVHRWISVE